MRKQVAFIRPKAVPIANVKMQEAISLQFADCDIDVIDVRSVIMQDLGVLGVNILLTGLLFANDILSGRRKFKEAFWHTPYIFKTVKRLLAKKLSHKKYWFTFQMQSLFDCSLPNTPHFIYTDHTHLANLSYAGFDRKNIYGSWVELERQIYQNARLNFVRSKNIRQSMIDEYQISPDKIKMVYAGSNMALDSSVTAEKQYKDQNILFVGIDWERKGGPDLIEAFKLVQQRFPKVSLTIVGSKPDIHLPNCLVLDQVPPSEINQYYSSATIFCLPTRIEPFGIAYLEAMQSRLPIVATNIGAVPDFIQNNWNGILVEPGDIQAIADGIMKLLANQDLCQLYGERNFWLSQERYSWNAVGKKIHEYIEENLSKDNHFL